MSTWRFVHAADLHLDSPFLGLRDLDPQLGQELLNATFKAFSNIVNLCLEQQVEFLLLAGDLYDGADRSLKAQLRLRQELARLSAAGIETYIVHGNHDHLGGGWISLEWPSGVQIFPAGPVTQADVRRQGQTLARIYGVSYSKAQVNSNLARSFPSRTAGPFSIGLLHANLGYNPEHDNYAPCTLADLDRCSYDYWALGHIHRHKVVRAREPAVVYAGNSQGRHFLETGPRGCYLVEVAASGQIRPQFIATDVVRWHAESFDLSDLQHFDQLLQALSDRLDSLRHAAQGRATMLQLNLKGRGPLHHDLKHADTLDELQEELRQLGRDEEPWVWTAKLGDATRAAQDQEVLQHDTHLLAEILKQIAAARQEQTLPQEFQQLLAPLFHNRVARHSLTWPDSQEWQAWLDQVTDLAFDTLLPPEE